MKAPFPYFGGKTRVASLVWEALGDVGHYIEPFCGSCAVLLLRPPFGEGTHSETVNDADSHICNVWRALKWKPDDVAEWCDWPVNHDDLRARKIVLNRDEPSLHSRLVADDMYCDPKMAGYYIWCASCWIGSGLTCPGKIPHLGDAGKGVHAPGKIPHLGDAGKGVHASGQRPHLGDAGKGVFGEPFGSHLFAWFRELQERLRYVRVVVGDWKQVCGGNWQADHFGTCGIFLDPPYSHDIGRHNGIYGHESSTAAHECAAWAIELGKLPEYRIVLAGYIDEHPALVEAGWRVHQWSTTGGYANTARGDDSAGNANRHREALFFSPHCLNGKEIERHSFF